MAQNTPIIWSFNPGKFATKNSFSAPNGERKDAEAFPSVIAPLGQVDDLGLGSSRMLTATVNGATYMGGAHAGRHPLANRSVSIDRLSAANPIYAALVQMSFQHLKLAERGNGKGPTVVLASALPAGWKTAEAVAQLEQHLRTGLKGLATIKDILVRSEQAAIVYHELMDDAGGIQRDNAELAKGLVCVADCGGGDINLAVLENLETVPDSALTIPLGSYELIELVSLRAGIPLTDAEKRIRHHIESGAADSIVGPLLQQYRESAIDKLTKAWRDFTKNTTVRYRFGGGTSLWLAPVLHQAFGSKAKVVKKPQQAVAIGMYKYASRQIARGK